MEHPLKNYRAIATPNFIFQVEEKFFTNHFANLEKDGLHAFKEEDNNRIMVMGVDMEGKDFSEYVTFSSYFLTEYNQLEKESRLEIDKTVLSLLDEVKQQVFIKNIVNELQVLHNSIYRLSFQPKYDVYKSMLLDKIDSFSRMLQEIYQLHKQEVKTTIPKIQWLEGTNLLTTLFYDLLNGQKKTRKGTRNTKALIKAKTTDIEKLLVDNFLDFEGKPLKPATIKTYLNNSRPETRVAEGGRIELDF